MDCSFRILYHSGTNVKDPADLIILIVALVTLCIVISTVKAIVVIVKYVFKELTK